MQFSNLMGLLLGGSLGTGMRWLIGTKIPFQSAVFSWSTFSINSVACFFIGLLWNKIESETARLFWITGFLGGFSTFSGLAMELLRYLENHQYKLAAVYGLSSIIFGILLAWFGQRFSAS